MQLKGSYMLRVVLLVILYSLSSVSAFAQSYTKKSFEELRVDLRASYAKNPTEALTQLKNILNNDELNPTQKIVMLNYKAWFELEARQFEEAMRTLVLYKNLVQRSDKPSLIYGYYNISGGIYTQLGMYQLAIEHFLKALEHTKKDNKNLAQQTLNNLAEVYLQLGRLDEAEDIYRKYLDYATALKNPLSISISTNNLIKTLIAKQQYAEAKTLALNIIIDLQDNDFKYYLAEAYLLLGEIEQANNDYPLAKQHYEKALSIFQQQGLPEKISQAHFFIAQIYADMGDLNKANTTLALVIASINKQSNLLFVSRVYKFQSSFLESQSLYKQSINAYKKHTNAHTQLVKQQSDVNLAKALAEADSSSKEVEITELTRTKQLKETKAKAFQELSIAITISLLVILFGSFFAVHNIHKREQRLAKTLDELHKTQSQLLEAEKIAALTVLVTGLAHQLNTPIGTAATASSLIEENLKRLSQKFNEKTLSSNDFSKFIQETNEAKDFVINNINRLANIVEEFKALSVSIAPDIPMRVIPLKTFITDRVTTLQNHFKKHISFNVIGTEVSIPTYPSIVSDVIKTLIINAYEHGFVHTDDALITIEISVVNNHAVIIFQDNGSGIDDKILKDIFTPFYSTNMGGNHLGLGLNIVFNAVKQSLNGNICAEQCKLGACFKIVLPLNGPVETL